MKFNSLFTLVKILILVGSIYILNSCSGDAEEKWNIVNLTDNNLTIESTCGWDNNQTTNSLSPQARITFHSEFGNFTEDILRNPRIACESIEIRNEDNEVTTLSLMDVSIWEIEEQGNEVHYTLVITNEHF